MLKALQISSMPAPRAQQSTTVPFQAGTIPATTNDTTGINITELMNLMITMMIVVMMMKMMTGMMTGL